MAHHSREQVIRQQLNWVRKAQALGSVTAACVFFGISRKTYSNWWHRYAATSWDCLRLADRSRPPLQRHPLQPCLLIIEQGQVLAWSHPLRPVRLASVPSLRTRWMTCLWLIGLRHRPPPGVSSGVSSLSKTIACGTTQSQSPPVAKYPLVAANWLLERICGILPLAVSGTVFDEALVGFAQMLLSQLLDALPAALISGISGRVDRNILGIESDSRRVTPGDLFVASRWGMSDGHDRVKEAISGGATALVLERAVPLESQDITTIFVHNSRQALARLASRFHGDPAQHLILIGVTGTKGKTTTCHLIKSIFDHAGLPAGFMGTAGCDIGGQLREVPRPAFTTPMPTDLYRFLAEMVKAGQKAVALEVTSQALVLDRLHGLPFAVAVFTNLGRDHLEVHGTQEAYFTAKASLFEALPVDERPRAIINIDDPWGRRLLDRSNAKPMSYGSRAEATVRLATAEIRNNGSRIRVQTPHGEVHIDLSLLGRLHSFNALAALAVGLAWQLPVEVIRRGLESVKTVPGRFEPIHAGQPFLVIVDYAYSPDSLERVLRAARPLTGARLILVCGCEGERQPEQRPVMGAIAAQFADLCIVTAHNPRHEDPEAIARDIVAGMGPAAHYQIICDRREAISFAVEQAREGEIVMIAGKGHETVQLIGDETIHFDDREIAREALRKRYPP